MKRRILQLTICVLSALLLIGVLSACNHSAVDDFDCLVEFNYNVSAVKMPGVTVESSYLGINYGSLIQLRPSRSDKKFTLKIIGHGYVMEDNTKWYLPLLDEDGNIQLDANGFVLLDREWDFETERVEADSPYIKPNEDGIPTFTLYARNVEGYLVSYVQKEADGTETVLNNYAGTHKPGSQLSYPRTSRQLPKREGWTFLGRYYSELAFDENGRVDEENSVPFWNHVVDENGNETDEYEPYIMQKEDVTIYVTFMEGDFRIVREATDLLSALSDSTRSVYIDADLDMTGITWAPLELNTTVEGNGHTISNISFLLDPSARLLDKDEYYFGLFSILRPSTVLKDLTFANVQITFHYNTETPMDTRCGALAGTAEMGAKVSGVSVQATLTEQNKGFGQQIEIVHSGIVDDRTANGDIIANCQLSIVQG